MQAHVLSLRLFRTNSYQTTFSDDENNEVEINSEKKGKIEPSNVLSLSNLCDDQDVNQDAAFVDDFQSLLERHQTSKLFTPFMSQLKSVQRNARRSLKRRIDQKRKVI